MVRWVGSGGSVAPWVGGGLVVRWLGGWAVVRWFGGSMALVGELAGAGGGVDRAVGRCGGGGDGDLLVPPRC